MRELPHTRSCFVCGESNPAGMRMRFETDGKTVRARFRPRAEHIGFRDTVHGGLIATLLDEIMVWAGAVAARRFSYCAELTVRYLAPARPGEELLLSGELVENRRDRLFLAKSELHDAQGRALATATGKYIPIKAVDAEAMAADFVGDPGPFFGPG